MEQNSNNDTNKNEESFVNESLYNSISKYNIPSFNKILVTHDGKDTSNKAVNHAIALSNLSGAEIVLLRIVEHANTLENTSVKIEDRMPSSNSNTSNAFADDNTSDKIGLNGAKESNKSQTSTTDISGPLVEKMEETVKECRQAGCNNNITYKFRTGELIPEIVEEINTGGYDLIVLTSIHFDSWIKSLFSDTRKILNNTNIPVFIIK